MTIILSLLYHSLVRTFFLCELCTTIVKVERKESVKDDEGNEDGDSLMSDWSTSINVNLKRMNLPVTFLVVAMKNS